MTIEDIRNFGADIEEGMGRCMGNAAFYIRLVKLMPKDRNFGILYDSIDKGDLDAAFEAAHALKGALGNLSLTALFDPMVELTELLRDRTQMDYAPLIANIKAKHAELEKLCNS